jgi:hypothetical protein
MRRLLSVSFLGLLISVSAGCECWDCFMQFENWKNQTLFGCCQTNNCPPVQQYQYAPIDCAGVVGYGGVQDCAGIVTQSPVMQAPCADGSCASGACGAPGQGFIAPGNIYAPVPGQVIAPGQVIGPGQVITPGPTVVPGPETYAPTM